MGYRLSKIVTKTGDDGTTGLGDGSRIEKCSLRIETIGDVDELNCQIGVAMQYLSTWYKTGILEYVQHRLFDLGGELSMPETYILDEGDVEDLEKAIGMLNNELSPLENFVLPGGSKDIAHTHLARAVCRRVERSLVKLSHYEDVNIHAIHYLNRLSDLLFIIARSINPHMEVLWKPKEKPNV